MKNRYIALFLSLFIAVFVNAQQHNNGKHWSILKKIRNEKTDFFVSNLVRFSDSTGRVTKIVNTVMWENKQMKKIAYDKNAKELIPELVALLNDPNRDWAANILLYSITNTDAVILKYYLPNKYEEWRKIRKNRDVKRWNEYLKQHKQRLENQ